MVHKKEKSFDILSAFNAYAPGWGGMFALLGLLLLGSVIGNVLIFIINICGISMSLAEQMLLTYPLMFIPAMFYGVIKSRMAGMHPFNQAEELPLDSYKVSRECISKIMLAFMCAVGTITTAVLVEPLAALVPTTGPIMGPFYQFTKQALEMLTGAPLWIALLSTAIFAPFFEEWLCRGMVLRGLLQKTSPYIAIIVSAVFFAAIHMNPWQAVPAFTLGCLFGLVYYKTGSLKLTMLMHCVNNSFSVLMSRIPAFEGKEYVYDIICDPCQRLIFYSVCAALTFLLVVRVLKLK